MINSIRTTIPNLETNIRAAIDPIIEEAFQIPSKIRNFVRAYHETEMEVISSKF